MQSCGVVMLAQQVGTNPRMAENLAANGGMHLRGCHSGRERERRETLNSMQMDSPLTGIVNLT